MLLLRPDHTKAKSLIYSTETYRNKPGGVEKTGTESKVLSTELKPTPKPQDLQLQESVNFQFLL